MAINNPRWGDIEHTLVLAEIDGREVAIPVDPGNRHYAELRPESGPQAVIAEFEPQAE